MPGLRGPHAPARQACSETFMPETAPREGEGVAPRTTIGHPSPSLRWRGVNRLLGRPRASAAEGG